MTAAACGDSGPGRMPAPMTARVSVARLELTYVEHHGFICRRCGHAADRDGAGTRHRNHCPDCLWSLHLDQRPGDRAADCGGLMEPIAVWVRGGGEWALVHRCGECGALRSNRVAGDDSALSLMSLAVKALASPPFPLEHLGRMERADDVER